MPVLQILYTLASRKQFTCSALLFKRYKT